MVLQLNLIFRLALWNNVYVSFHFLPVDAIMELWKTTVDQVLPSSLCVSGWKPFTMWLEPISSMHAQCIQSVYV